MRERAYKREVAMPRSKPTTNHGVCRLCGCTQERACPGTSCAWVDESRTLCTACIGKLSVDELYQLYERELTSEYEPGHVNAFRPMPDLSLCTIEAATLIGALDLVMRFPGIESKLGQGVTLIKKIREGYVKHLSKIGPATVEMLRRGADPRHDVADDRPLSDEVDETSIDEVLLDMESEGLIERNATND